MEIAELLARWDADSEFGELLRRIAFRTTVAASGCWECSYSQDGNGYAQVSFLSRMESVHRVMYVAAKGLIPSALQIDHLCRNRGCCNPAHLEAVPSRENTMRGETIIARNAAVTHCPQGHRYSPDNAFPCDIRRGKQRRCRACHLIKTSERKRRQRSAA